VPAPRLSLLPLLAAVACTSTSSTTSTTTPTTLATTARSGPGVPFSTAPSVSTLHLVHVGDTEAGMLAGEHGGGVARAAAVIGALRQRAGQALVVHAGDTLIPAPELAVEIPWPAEQTAAKPKTQRPLLVANNSLGLQVAVPGNHDFDLGESFLADVIQKSTFPWVASTLTVDGGPLAPLVDVAPAWLDDTTPAPAAGRIVPRARRCLGERRGDVCDGIVVGVIGAVPETLRLLSAGATTVSVPVDVGGTVAALQQQVDALRAEGVSIIVLLSHRQGVANDLALLDAGLIGVDVIVSGGGENRLVPAGQRHLPGASVDPLCSSEAHGCYPVWRAARDGAPVAVVATDGGLHTVGALTLSFDATGVATGVEPGSRPWFLDEEALLELRAEVDRTLLRLELDTRDALAPLQEVLGEVDVWLEGRRELVRNGETNLGSLTADALWRAARQEHPDVVAAFRNSGAVRDSIGVVTADGRRTGKPVTLLDLQSALRFDSAVVVVELSHAELATTLEAALAGAGTGQGRFPQVSAGVEIVYARSGRDQQVRVDDGRVVEVVTPGTRLRRLVVPGPDGPIVVVEGGVVQTPAARIRMATIDYLAGGGDGWFPGQQPTVLTTSSTEHRAFRALVGDAAALRQSLAVTGRIIAVP
jgi:2',3'-cyclic-nucleotide 2'-phosphodiesterase (5'-nucleotidase family)